MSIDDYYKTIGYACLYKGLGETVNQVPAEEVTISIFRESYPRELFETLKNMGMDIKEYSPGIFYITGQKVLFDTQVVVIRRLNKETHRTLRVLSRNVQEEDTKGFISEAVHLMDMGDRNNIDAVLQVSVSANRELYEAIRRGDEDMCDAMRELMREDLEKKEQKTLLEKIKNLMG